MNKKNITQTPLNEKPHEIESIAELNNKSDKLAKEAINSTKCREDAIAYARETYSKNDLDSYYNVGNLSNVQMAILKTKTNKIKLSIDSTVKNKINHPDIGLNDYKKIPQIIKTPDNVIKINDSKIMLTKTVNNRKFILIIKSTQNKKENFLISFRYNEH